jgi:hypothetical protein
MGMALRVLTAWPVKHEETETVDESKKAGYQDA